MKIIGTLIMIIAIVGTLAGMFLTFGLIFSPKLKAKLMKNQIQAAKYLAENSKDDLVGLAEANADLMDASKDSLKKMADINAEIRKDALETTSEAISKGIKKGLKK